jgi:Tol biopolymer transport system component
VDYQTGGRLTRLCSLPYVMKRLDESHHTLTWSPGAKALAFPYREGPDAPVAIFQLAAGTGEKPRRLTTPPPNHSGDVSPAFSPDGRWLAFLREKSVRWANDVYLMPATGGEPRPLTNDNLFIHGLAWTPDSRQVVFSSNREGGLYRLWRIATTGGQPEELSRFGEEARHVAIAAQGDRLAYVRALDRAQLRRIQRPAAPAERPVAKDFAPSAHRDLNPRYSLDGRRVTFVSDRTGNPEVFVCDSAGLTRPAKVTSFDPYATGTPRLSDDGQEVVFDSRKSGRSAIWAVGVDDNSQPRQLTKGQEDLTPSWSHNKQWVYFTRKRNETFQIWKVSVRDGQEVPLATKRGGVTPFESTDGWVYYYAPKPAAAFYKVPVEGGEESRVFEVPQRAADYFDWGSYFGWTLTGHGIFFLGIDAASGPTLEFFDFASRQTTLIAQLDKNPSKRFFGVVVSPDDKWILYSEESLFREIMLVENFR